MNPCIQTDFSHFITIVLYFVLHSYKLHNASISVLCIYTNIELI